VLVDAAALLVALALFRYFTRGMLFGRGRLPPPATRTAYLARLTWRPLVLFGGGSAVLLALTGDLPAIGAVPQVLAPVQVAALRWTGGRPDPAELGWPIAIGMVAGALLAAVLARRGRSDLFGDTRAVMPRCARELPWGAAMALSAGVGEELFFRCAVPLYAARIAAALGAGTWGVWAAVALGTALFGLAHRYQGWRGMVATGAIGALLMLAYLVSGTLWAAVALHVLLDLNALVVRPVLAGWRR
jgi:uncharacterized protein